MMSLLKVTREDRRELRHLAASAKFGCKLALSFVAVASCVMCPPMIPTILDCIWDTDFAAGR